MDNKEIILSRIADVMGRNHFIKKDNSELKARLKCVGLEEYFDKYSEYLIPYWYNRGFENENKQYSVFLGLDGIFTDLYHENRLEDIIRLLKELTKSFNINYISEEMGEDFEELANLYELLGIKLHVEFEKVTVEVCMESDIGRVNDLFSVESWLETNHWEVYDAYKSAVDAYTQGHAGMCIESCRTCLVSIFSKYKGTEEFAKWMRGVFNTSGEDKEATLEEFSKAIGSQFQKKDLAEFFYENQEGKLTKTKTVYMIYSMLSDYGTHRNEGTVEQPTLDDALFSLRLTDSILLWVYSRRRDVDDDT